MRHAHGHGAFRSLPKDRRLSVRMCRALSLFAQRHPDEGADGTATARLASVVANDLYRRDGRGAQDTPLLVQSYSDWLKSERRGGSCAHELPPAGDQDCSDVTDALIEREVSANDSADFKHIHAHEGDEFSEVVGGALEAGADIAWVQLGAVVHKIIDEL